METDFTFANHGSIVLLTPVSESAEDWVEEHIPAEAMHFGKATVIEPRYAGPILEGIADAGLSVAEV